MAMGALSRPGPMESIPEYIRRKNHPELIEYLDPRMKDYLDQSLGLIVYQDDVLLTAIHLAGYNWEEADKFRKAMGKKIPEEMAKQKEKFFKGAREHGKVSDIKIHRLWELIEPFAAYGFNKAHAASYGVVAYQTGFMKANFPLQFMTAVLIAESGDIDKVPAIIHECERMGIKVLPPDINESFKNFAMISSSAKATDDKSLSKQVGSLPSVALAEDGAHIRFGLNGIKNLGEHIAEVIYDERKKGGRFKTLDELLTRVKDRDLNKKSLESLIKCGAMDSFGYDRGMLLANSENILSFVRDSHEQSSTNQHSLFAGSAIDIVSKVRLNPAPAATAEEKVSWEKELLGLYVTSHPFGFFQKYLANVLTPITELSAQARKQWVVVGGVIDSTKKKITRGGKPMMFVTIQDTTSSLELLVFPRTYETTKDVWVVGKTVCVVGKTSEEEGDDKLFVEKAYTVTKENVQALAAQMVTSSSSVRQYVEPEVLKALTSDGIEIALTADTMKTKAEAIKEILKKYPGDKTVYIKVGEKRIKTAFRATESQEMLNDLKNILKD